MMLKFTKLIRFVIKKYFCITEPFLLKDIAANFLPHMLCRDLMKKNILSKLFKRSSFSDLIVAKLQEVVRDFPLEILDNIFWKLWRHIRNGRIFAIHEAKSLLDQTFVETNLLHVI